MGRDSGGESRGAPLTVVLVGRRRGRPLSLGLRRMLWGQSFGGKTELNNARDTREIHWCGKLGFYFLPTHPPAGGVKMKIEMTCFAADVCREMPGSGPGLPLPCATLSVKYKQHVLF